MHSRKRVGYAMVAGGLLAVMLGYMARPPDPLEKVRRLQVLSEKTAVKDGIVVSDLTFADPASRVQDHLDALTTADPFLGNAQMSQSLPFQFRTGETGVLMEYGDGYPYKSRLRVVRPQAWFAKMWTGLRKTLNI